MKDLPAIFTAAGAIFGLLGVVLGAFGAHALKETLTARESLGTWQTAVLYQFVHALALAAAASWAASRPGGVLLTAVLVLWALGILLFSGSLYGLALGGPRWLGPITPIGGLALIAGWACLLVSALRAPAAS